MGRTARQRTAAQGAELQRLKSSISEALPQLLTFVTQLDQIQHDLRSVLEPTRQAVLGLGLAAAQAAGLE